MGTHYVHIEADAKPEFLVEVEAEGDEPTEDEIGEAIEELAQQITYEGYLAEFAENVGWHVGIEPKQRVLVIRDPDSENEFVTEGAEVEVYDIDLGRFDLGEWDEFAPWAASHLAYTATLSSESAIRARIETIVVETYNDHSSSLELGYRRWQPQYSLPEITSARDLRDFLAGEEL